MAPGLASNHPCRLLPWELHFSKNPCIFAFSFFSAEKFGELLDEAFYSSKLTRKLLPLTLDWRWYFSRDKSWEWGEGVSRLFCPFPQNLRLTPRVLYDVFGASSGQITFHYVRRKIVDIIESRNEKLSIKHKGSFNVTIDDILWNWPRLLEKENWFLGVLGKVQWCREIKLGERRQFIRKSKYTRCTFLKKNIN